MVWAAERRSVERPIVLVPHVYLQCGRSPSTGAGSCVDMPDRLQACTLQIAVWFSSEVIRRAFETLLLRPEFDHGSRRNSGASEDAESSKW